MRIAITFQIREDSSYIELINMAFASAKRFGYETVNVGNAEIEANHQIKFNPGDLNLLMNWVLGAQLAFIESDLFDQPSVLFSPDALIMKPLYPVFVQHNFDVAFTDRNNPKWPINNGVIYLRPEKKKEIAALWRDAIAVCRAYPIQFQEWYGDQKSLWDIYTAKRHELYGLKCALLPCRIYNATPDDNASVYDVRMLEQAYVAHFKGKRKHKMQTYWDYLCAQKI